MTTFRRLLTALPACALVLAAACGGDDDGPSGEAAGGDGEVATGATLRVPDDHDTIQSAVDAAEPGDLVLVAPGTYEEAVTVGTDELTIRGLDRNEVVLDGGFELDNGIRVAGADGVAVENMTARNYTNNGFFWTGVEGYRGSYLTTYRIGDYGIYAYDATQGLIEHSYASGSPDAGFYIGQCFPCNALVIDVESEWNGLGYSGTNAGGDLLIARSAFHDNRAGIVPNSGSYEKYAPERQSTIVGNHVYNNNNAETAAIEIAEVATGNGILLAGGNDNVVERNLVTGHEEIGIGAVPLPEKALQPDDADAVDFDARGNTVRENELSGNGYDLVAVTNITDATDDGGNCFADNDYSTSAPPSIEQALPCESPARGFTADIALLSRIFLTEKPQSADYATVALPGLPALANMPKAKTARARPATSEPSIKVKAESLAVPTGS
jgi:hypothetical protein